MTQRTMLWMATAVLGLLSSTSALALESGFYMGALGGQGRIGASKSEYDIDERQPFATGFSSSLDDSDTSLGLVFGGQFGRWVAVESQLISLGEYKYKSSQTIRNYFPTAPRNLDIQSDNSAETAVATLCGILTVPVGEHVAFGFRLGIASNATSIRYEYEERRGNSSYYRETDDNDAEASDAGPTYGVSVEWDPFKHFGVRLDYQIITHVGGEDDDYDDYDEYDDEEERAGSDVDLISLSLIGRF